MTDDNQNSYLTSLLTITYSGATGYIIKGRQGASIGVIMSIADQYLINNNNFITQYYDKNYLTLYLYWYCSFRKGISAFGVVSSPFTKDITAFNLIASSLTKVIADFSFITPSFLKATFPKKITDQHIKSTILLITSAALPALQTVLADDFLDFKEKTLIPLKSLNLVNKIYNKDNIFSKDNLARSGRALFKDPLNAFVVVKNNFYKFYENKFQTSFVTIFGLSIVNELINYYLYRKLLGNDVNDIFSKLIMQDESGFGKLKKTSNELELSFETLTPTQIFIIFLKNNKKPFKATEHKMHKFMHENFLYLGRYVKFISLYGFGIFLDSWFKEYINNQKKILINVLFDNSQNITREHEKNHQGKTLLSVTKNIFTQHTKDITNAFGAAFKITEIASDTFKSLSSYQIIMTHTPEIFLYHVSTLGITQPLLKGYLSDSRNNSQDLLDTDILDRQNTQALVSNIESIILGDALDYNFDKYTTIIKKRNGCYAKESGILLNIDYLKKYEKISSVLIGSPYLLYKFIKDGSLLVNLFNILSSSNQLMSFYSYNILSKIGSTKEEISLSNLESFYNVINKKEDNPIIYTVNNQKKIIYSNYSVYKENVMISHVENLEFNLSKKYLVTDNNLIYFYKNLKKSLYTPFSSSGEVSIAHKARKGLTIIYIDQNPYFPENLTLLEAIYFPKRFDSFSTKESKALKQKIINLFSQFQNKQNDHLELISDLHNSNFRLKSEQTKKIFIIRAILHEADIIIMDDTLTGLERSQVESIQSAIDIYLPGVTIFSFEKNPINHNSFYDYIVSYENGEFIQTPIGISNLSELYIEKLAIQGNCSAIISNFH
jgi:ABC-type branched-subunit amino acid transport system ATPase component